MKSSFPIKAGIDNLSIIIITSCIIAKIDKTKPNSSNKYFIFFLKVTLIARNKNR